MGRSTTSRVLRVTTLMAVALLLTGCFKVDMRLTVRANDTVDGSMILALENQFAGMAGGQANQVLTSIEQSLQGLGAKTSSKPYSDSKFTGQQVTFTGAPAAEVTSALSQSGSTFSLTHTGGSFVFDGNVDVTRLLGGGTPSGAPSGMFDPQTMQQMLQTAEFTISITFPGKVTSTNGTVNGTTVTWKLDLTGNNTLHAESEDSGAVLPPTTPVGDDVPSTPWGLIVGIVAAILVLLGLGGLLWSRTRKPGEKAPPIPVGATLPPRPKGPGENPSRHLDDQQANAPPDEPTEPL